MAIAINWVDRNITVDKFRVYRASTPILDGALPAVLAEVPAGTYSYLDLTAVRNQVYHYRVSAVVGAEETLSANMPLAYMPYTGPGPQQLLRGDWSLGTFGRMKAEDLFTAAELCSMQKNALILPATDSRMMTSWIKMVYNGKILFVPDQCVSYSGGNWTWADLYKEGLVYGQDDPSTWSAQLKTTYGVIPQNFQVTNGKDVFVVRLPGSRVGALTASAVPANQYGGEFDFINAPLFLQRVLASNIASMDDIVLIGSAQLIFTKDVTTTAGDTVIIRGTGIAQPDQVTTALYNGTVTFYSWRPILELVL